jgi:hypothetical protein
MAGLWPAGWEPVATAARIDAAAAPLILTVALPEALQQQADAVRNALAPAAAVRAPAHLSLFRHLPGLQLAEVVNRIRRAAARPAPALAVGAPTRRGGRWMAPVTEPGLDALRAELADQLHGLIAPGDHAPPHLHISLSSGKPAPPPLGEGPWKARGLLLWRHEGAHPDAGRGGSVSGAERGEVDFAAERGGAFWTPLVAVAFRG